MLEKYDKVYYIVIVEALYPDSSYYDPKEIMFESKDEALEYAKTLANEEKYNLEEFTHLDFYAPELYDDDSEADGYIVTAKNGIDPWCAYARVLAISAKI